MRLHITSNINGGVTSYDADVPDLNIAAALDAIRHGAKLTITTPDGEIVYEPHS